MLRVPGGGHGIEAVADPADRRDAVCGELLAQPVDVLGHGRLGLPVAGRIPDRLEQLGPGEHLPWRGHEELEQVELLCREGQLLAVEVHLAALRVEPQPAVDEAVLGRRPGVVGRGDRRAPEPDPDPGHELSVEEGLDDVVVGAELEGQHAVGLVGPAGQHDDRHLMGSAHGAEQVEPVHVGQAEIEDDDARLPLLDGRQRIGSGGHRLHLETVAGQQLLEDAAN